ncbi:MAG: hypothetical protein NC120_07870 [Ruminococcus sp.]|nr:hypothetical protein [Ruminococcus sp.]
MRKILKTFSAAAAGLFAAAMMVFAVYAEDYEFDVSDAKETTGSWGQSFVHYTALSGADDSAGNFNPEWMTSDSEVIVEYTYDGDASGNPLELIWQTWDDGPNEVNPDVRGTWNKVTPYEYDSTSAKFSYDDIVTAYGTSDFNTVYAICIGDAGVKLKVTAVTVTNCDITAPEPADTDGEEDNEEEEAEETEAAAEKKTEAKTEKETEAPEEEVTEKLTTTVNIAANAPQDDSILPIVIAIVVVLIVGVIAAVIVIKLIKNNKGRYY